MFTRPQFSLGTKVQGFAKHELNDVWASAQLWIIARVPNTDTYTIQNANSRTYLDLSGSTSHSSPTTSHAVSDNTRIRL